MTDERWTRLDQADYERKRRREISSCPKCGEQDPIRLGHEGCDECCNGWPRCDGCGCWLDLQGMFAVSSRTFDDGTFCGRCRPQWNAMA